VGECLAFLKEELGRNVKLTPPFNMTNARDTIGEPPASTSDNLWDLRVRMTDFVRRFLRIFKEPEASVDPFTVFFLRPMSGGGEDGGNVQSGLFGYEYVIDKGQQKYLEDNQEFGDVRPESLHLPFPNGVCARAFLE